MPFELRLIEDTPFAGDEVRYATAVPRAFYTAVGSVTFEGDTYPEDEGFVSAAAVSLRAGEEGATIWRWELVSSNTASDPDGARSVLRLSAPVDLATIAKEHLIRLDSVAFPPGGTAMLHIHQGPGIRCLREGSIRIDTEGRSCAYAPGGPWFERGPEPVFAQAAMDRDSRFIRAMVLPRALLGASSIRYVNDEDRDKPKSQTYRVYAEAPFDIG